MKLVNIKKQYDRKYFEICSYISSLLSKAKCIEEKAQVYIGICTLVFFFIGMMYDMGAYAFTGIYSLAVLNLSSLAIFVISAFLYLRRKLCLAGTLSVLLFTVQGNVAVSIAYNYATITRTGDFVIYHDLFIGFLVCILGALTLKKNKVFILCALPLASLATAMALHSPIALIKYFPSLCLAYVSPPVFLTRIRVFLFGVIQKKEQLIKEKQALYRLMGMTEEQWDLMLGVIQAPHTPRDKAERIFDMMQDTISNQLVIRAKRLLSDEESIGRISEKLNLGLSGNEIQLCSLILEDKSIADISRLLYINESTVRANRCRLRKKLGLSTRDNLKAHLLRLVGEEKKNR